MPKGKKVRVRILQTVTYGEGPTWQVGEVLEVSPELAAVMVSSGEAVYRIGRETVIAVGSQVARTR